MIATGSLLTAFNAGLLSGEYRRVIFSWPMLLMAIGFPLIFGGKHKAGSGIVLMLVGGVFLMIKFNLPYTDFVRNNLWGCILILVGLVIILKSIFFRKFHRKKSDECRRQWDEQREEFRSHRRRRNQARAQQRKHGNGADMIDRNCVFGSVRYNCDSHNFKGGEVNCVFGSVVVDFSNAQLAEGENNLEINTVFGGIVLYIPADWNLEIYQTNVFGGFVDKRPRPSFEVVENRKLVLQISSVFGGGEIKSHDQSAD